jgi:hypothetical protein
VAIKNEEQAIQHAERKLTLKVLLFEQDVHQERLTASLLHEK